MTKSKPTYHWSIYTKPWLYFFAILSLLVLICMACDALFPLNTFSQEDLSHGDLSQGDMFARVVVDREGKPLRAFPDKNGVWRYHVKLDDLAPSYLEALLTYEDRRFWYHMGIDPIAIVRAAITNIRYRKIISGGSTLSMQVARLLHPHARTIPGKIYQVLRTLQLEWHFTKKEILTLYCNIAPFGGTIQGVQAASYTYLNKPAHLLTHAESALLAVLPQSPTRYRPDLHPQIAQTARDKVLERMVTLKKWPADMVNDAKLERVYAVHNRIEQHAPLLSRRLIQNTQLTHSRVIRTYIDRDIQTALEDYVAQYIEQQNDNSSAAVLIADNTTAEVIAYIGTADFANTQRFGHVDMVNAIRSPGSTLKPFLYALALDEGLIHSHSLLSDVPTLWGSFQPSNFNGGFSGPVSASDALQRSLNIPAVQLLNKLGPNSFHGRLKNAGINMHMPNNKANLSMILGGGGLRLEDLVTGYMALANQGLSQELRLHHTQQHSQKRYLFSPQAAWVTQKILREIPRPNAIRSVAVLNNKPKLAWKTGTSYGHRDAWAIGVDKNYTIGVWLGRPDGTPVPKASGRLSAGPLLHTIADHLPQSRLPIPKPQHVSQHDICWPLGTLKSEQDAAHCHQTQRAWIIHQTVPPTFPDKNTTHTNPLVYWVDKHRQRRTNTPCLLHNPTNKTEKQSSALWPITLEPWLHNSHRRSTLLPNFDPDCHPPSNTSAALSIVGISPNTQLQSISQESDKPRITLKAIGGEGQHHWYINGTYQYSASPYAPKAYEFYQKKAYEIAVLDDAGNTDRVMVTVQ